MEEWAEIRRLHRAEGMSIKAIAEAEAALSAGLRMWEHFLRFRGVRSMELTEHTAIETGRIAAPALRAGT